MIVFAWFMLTFAIILFGLSFVSVVLWLYFKKYRAARKLVKAGQESLVSQS